MSVDLSTLVPNRDRRRERQEQHVDLSDYGHALVTHRLRPWQRKQLRRALVLDVLVAILAVIVGSGLRHFFFGNDASFFGSAIDLAALAVPVLWVLALVRSGAYARRYIGAGTDEYRTVTRAGLLFVAVVAFLSYAFKLEASRGFVLFAVPVLVLGTVLGRWLLRQNIARARRRGEKLQDTVVVGRADTAEDLAD